MNRSVTKWPDVSQTDVERLDHQAGVVEHCDAQCR
jgi:hypothetical protein